MTYAPPPFSATDAERLEQSYQTPEIVEQRARTRAALAPAPGESGLDVGCGPGLLACELALDVGARGRIVAIDSSAEMVAAARARAERAGVGGRVRVDVGDAATLAFDDGSFDFVAAVQVYLYVAAIERALAEAARVLRPDGRLVVVDTDWDSCVWLTADRARHRRMIEARLHSFAHPHLPPRVPGLLRDAGLRLAEASVIPILNVRYGPDVFSASTIGVVRGAALRHGVPREEADAWAADLRSRTRDGDYFFSVNRYLFRAVKG